MATSSGLQAYAYIDGAYLRAQGSMISVPYPNPRSMVLWLMKNTIIGGSVLLRRTSFYDAEPSNGEASPELEKYWKCVENLVDTDLRFGEVRGKPKRQKGVDVLLAVDMLSASFRKLFDVTILLAGDADFVPLVYEVRRLGVTVVVGGVRATTSRELQDAADRFIAIDSISCPAWSEEQLSVS